MKYWKRLNPDGSTKTVESYSHDSTILGATEIMQAEYDSFLASLHPPLPPDWKALWLAADTGTVAERIAKKIALLAKKAELE